MRSRNLLLIFLLFIVISVVISIISKDSFALEYNDINGTLFYKDDSEELSNDIGIYLNYMDDLIIPNSSYNYSNILRENYDFLTYFAIDYILNNIELYQDKIVILDEYSYFTKDGILASTNKYISLDYIYEIVSKYFNISYYYILDSNVKLIDNKIALVDYTYDSFDLEISNISLEYKDNYIYASVSYGDYNKYLYTFIIENMVLYIQNVEVIV